MRDGKPVKTSSTYTRQVQKNPPAESLLVERTDEAGKVETDLTASMGQAHYTRASATAPCRLYWGDLAEGGEPFNPAELLQPIDHGQWVGKETVSGVPAIHYAADKTALGLAPEEDGAAELWIAEPGGYVVKDSLTLKGQAVYSAPGFQSEQSMVYELQDINAGQAFALPVGCPAALTEIPEMPNATQLVRMPHSVSYTTTAKLANVAAFYLDRMPALGWTLLVNRTKSANPSLVFYRHEGKQRANLTFRAQGSGLEVFVSVLGE